MPTEVLAASRADQQIAKLTRKHARAFDAFVNGLAAHGCEALACRLSGTEPQRDSGRDKPPCCDKSDGEPPVLGDALADILDRAMKLRKTRQR